MDLLAILAKALDTKGYPDCKNQNHWKTVNHSHVHISKGGKINGGAGGKLNDNPWYGTKSPHVSVGYEQEEPDEIAQNPAELEGPAEKAVTKEDLMKSWEKANASKSAMNKAQKQSVKQKHAQKILEAIEAYKELYAQAPPEVQQAYKPKMDQMLQKANEVLNPILEPAETEKPQEMSEDEQKSQNVIDAFEKLEELKSKADNEGVTQELVDEMKKHLDKAIENSEGLSQEAEDKLQAKIDSYGWDDLFNEIDDMVSNGVPNAQSNDPMEALAKSTEPQEPDDDQLFKEMDEIKKKMSTQQIDLANKVADAFDTMDNAVYAAEYHGGATEADKNALLNAAFEVEDKLGSLGQNAKEYLSTLSKITGYGDMVDKAEAIMGVGMSSTVHSIVGNKKQQVEPQAEPPQAPTPKVEPETDPLSGLAEATKTPIPFADYKAKYTKLQSYISMLNSPVVKADKDWQEKIKKDMVALSGNLTGENYDNYSLDQKKQLWKLAGSKAQYMENVKLAAALANPKSIKHSDLPQKDQDALNNLWANKYSLNDALSQMQKAKDFDDKEFFADKINDLAISVEEAQNDLGYLAKAYMGASSNYSDTDSVLEQAQNALDLYDKEFSDKMKNDPMFALAHTQTFESVPPKKVGNTTQLKFSQVSDSVKKKTPIAKKGIESYKVLFNKCSDAWKKMKQAEKGAAYAYTKSYSDVNESLRGYIYGKGWSGGYVGAGKIDLDNVGVDQHGIYHRNPGEVKKKIKDITSAIEKSSYDHPVTLRRGWPKGMLETMLGLPQGGINASNVASFIGKEFTDHGFASCGASEETGFSGSCQMEIYAPAGTKMLYVEPFSAYGNGAQSSKWDGASTQHSVGIENEVILQRGTKFRIDHAEMKGGVLSVKVQIVAQEGYDID